MMNVIAYLIDSGAAAAEVGLIALGFAFIFRITGHIHFAYAAIWTFGSYIYGSRLDAGDGYPLAFFWVAITSILMSLGCFFIYRKLRSDFTILLASFGIYLAIIGTQLILWGPSQQGTDPSRTLAGVWSFYAFGSRLTVPLLYVVHALTVTVSALGCAWFLGRTRLGAEAAAVAENRELAMVTGISVLRIEVTAYVIGALLGAVSAAIQVTAMGSDVFTGTELFINALVIAIVAGHVVVGAAAASIVFGLVWAAAQSIFGTEFVTLVTYAILLSLILWRPSGLFARDLVL